MRKHYPLDPTGAENAALLPWSDGVPQTGTVGSYPGHALVTDPETEILNAQALAGLTAAGADLTQIAQAMTIGLFVGTFTGTANALTAALPGSVQIPLLLPGMKVRGLMGPSANSLAPTLWLQGFATDGGAKAIMKRDGLSALAAADLRPKALTTFLFDGTAWRLDGSAPSDLATLLNYYYISIGAPVILLGNTTYYVNGANGPITTNGITFGAGSDNNDGLSAGAPFATLTKMAAIVSKLNVNGFVVQVNVADGTYAPFLIGNAINGSLTITGDVANPAACVISSTTSPACIGANFGAIFMVQGFRLVNSAPNGRGIISQNNANVSYSAMDFGPCNGDHILSDNGVVQAAGNYGISGGATSHCRLTQGRWIITPSSPNTITLSGNPLFSSAFINADLLSSVRASSGSQGTTFSGSARGVKFISSNGSQIATNGAGVNFPPGDTAGVATTGSYS